MPHPRKIPGGRRGKEAIKKHLMSLWVMSETMKHDMAVAAKNDGRTINNYFNHHIAPIAESVLKSQLGAIPHDRLVHLRKQVDEDWAQPTKKPGPRGQHQEAAAAEHSSVP